MTGRIARNMLRARVRWARPEELARSAWVVSPHPDDETLGCGGLIARKRRDGVRVGVVFVTDGEACHGPEGNHEGLAERRQAEARAACGRLGVPEQDVHFLHLPDGEVEEHVGEGVTQLTELFRRSPADELCVPYRLEPPADHKAASVIGRLAAIEAGMNADVLEYPVWLWTLWPWSPWRHNGQPLRETVRRAYHLAGGMARTIRDLGWAVDVGEVLDVKRAALAEHRTQMERLDGPDWPVLADVDDGLFLRHLLQGYEVFRRTRAR